jgi:RNA polymerase sigma-70 factor (ECF subfamily)
MMLLQYWSHVATPSAPWAARDSAPTSPLSVEQIFHRYVPRLYSLARRMMGNEADAEDVIGDVLVQVLRKLDTFRGDADLATWLHRVTVNAALAQRRKLARRRERQVDVSLATLQEESSVRGDGPSSEAPEQQVLDGETRQMVENAIAGLPEMYRDVYVLSDVELLPNAEIGALLGLTVAAVKSRLHRARLLMRQALATYF